MLLNSLYWENECHRLRLTSFVLLEKTSEMDKVSLLQIFNRIPLLKYRYRGTFPSDYVPTLDNDTFAVIDTQPSNMQGEHWTMTSNSCQNLYLADSLGPKSTVSSSSNMNRWFQNHYNPIPSFAVSTRYMQLFIFSNSDKKKLQEFTMLMYFHSYFFTCNFPIFLLEMCRFYNVITSIYTI